MSIKRFVKTTRRYREVVITAGDQLITAADPLPDDLREAIKAISAPRTAHQFEPSQVEQSRRPTT